MYMDRDLEL